MAARWLLNVSKWMGGRIGNRPVGAQKNTINRCGERLGSIQLFGSSIEKNAVDGNAYWAPNLRFKIILRAPILKIAYK